MPDAATIGAGLLGLLSVLFVGRGIWLQAREHLPREPPAAQNRADAATRLWNLYPAFPDEEPDTALFLLEESKRTYDGWIDSNARIEAKATWLTGFLAGGAGLLTVFGSGHVDKAGTIEPGPFLWLAIGAAFLALVSSLYVVRPKLRPHPEVSDYISTTVALSQKARFHLALSLAEDYTRSIRTIAHLRRFDPIAWSASQFFLVVGIVAILIHFALHIQGAPASKPVLQCQGQEAPFKGGSTWKARCEEH